MKCCVLKCKSSTNNKEINCSYFRFPNDEEISEKWKIFSQRGQFYNFKNAYICMLHFSNDAYKNLLEYEMGFSSKKYLKPGAVPTLPVGFVADKNAQRQVNKEIVASLLHEHESKTSTGLSNNSIIKNSPVALKKSKESDLKQMNRQIVKKTETVYDPKFADALLQQYEDDLKLGKERKGDYMLDDYSCSSASYITTANENGKNKKLKLHHTKKEIFGDYEMTEYSLAEKSHSTLVAQSAIKVEEAKKDKAKSFVYTTESENTLSAVEDDFPMDEQHLKNSNSSSEEGSDNEECKDEAEENDNNAEPSELMPIINEKLVEAVRKQKILWCKKYSTTNKIEKKDLAWKRIGQSLNTSGFLCKRRWKSLRDGFLKAKKNGLHGKGQCYEELRFLEENHVVTRRRKPNNESKCHNPDVNELELIKKVKQYPVLYDTDLPENKNINFKAKIWKRIAESLNADRYICQTVWLSLLKTYHLKKDRVHPWEFTEHMSFLKNIRYLNRLKLNVEDEVEIEKLAPLSSMKLIIEVRHYEFLYNPNLNDFADNEKHKLAWIQIAKNLKHDVIDCQERWQDLCFIYGKYKLSSSSSNGNVTTTWQTAQYIESMSFLDKYYEGFKTYEEDNNYRDHEEDQQDKEDLSDDNEEVNEELHPSIPIEQFINEVKKHDELYNSNRRDFKLVTQKTAAWQQIGAKFGVTDQVCRDLWQNIHNSYKVPINYELDEATGVLTSPMNKYASQLSFLDEFMDIITIRQLIKSNEVLDSMKLKIIEEVKKRPQLYDRRNNNKIKKCEIWETVSQELKTNSETCQQIWRNLCYEYKKYKVRKCEDPSTSWKFSQQMSYFDDILIPNTDYDYDKNPLDLEKIKLIQEVEKFPILYNANLRAGRAGIFQRAWQSVADAMNMNVNTCKDKWLRLRKSYRGYKKKSKNQIKKWKYADYLTFLDDCLTEKRSVKADANDEMLHANRLQIIEEVKKRPILYSSLLPDNDLKNIEWERISSQINVDANTCKETWKKLRYKYNRDGASDPTWKYSSVLSFLETSNTKNPLQIQHSKVKNQTSNDNFIEQAIFCKKLIKQVISHRVLYEALDNASPQEITNAWLSISKALNAEVEICQSKWNYLKYTYRSRKAAKRPWIFMNDMKHFKRFLIEQSSQSIIIPEESSTEFIDVHALDDDQQAIDMSDTVDLMDTNSATNNNDSINLLADVLDSDSKIMDNSSSSILDSHKETAAAATTVIAAVGSAMPTTNESESCIEVFLDYLQSDIIKANITFKQTMELKSCLSVLVYSKLTEFQNT